VDRLRIPSPLRRKNVLILVGRGTRNKAVAFLTILSHLPTLPLSVPRTGIGSPLPSAVSSRLTIHLRLPLLTPVVTAVGSARRTNLAPLKFVPRVSAHAPLWARAVLLAILSALTPPMNLNRVVDVPRSAKARIAPLLKVHGTSHASKAAVQVKGLLLRGFPSF